MYLSSSLDKDENEKLISKKEYKCIIGSFLYLTPRRHGKVFATDLCATFRTYAI